MKKALFICLLPLVLLSVGCGKQEEAPKTTKLSIWHSLGTDTLKNSKLESAAEAVSEELGLSVIMESKASRSDLIKAIELAAAVGNNPELIGVLSYDLVDENDAERLYYKDNPNWVDDFHVSALDNEMFSFVKENCEPAEYAQLIRGNQIFGVPVYTFDGFVCGKHDNDTRDWDIPAKFHLNIMLNSYAFDGKEQTEYYKTTISFVKELTLHYSEL